MELKIFTKTIKISSGNIAVIISIISLLFAGYANIISNHANSIAEDANNISLKTQSYQEIIGESDLRVGTFSSGKNNLNETFIRVPIINGYYARYPATVITEGFNIYLNGNESIKLNIEPPYNLLVGKDKPVYFVFVFGNSTNSSNWYFVDDVIVHLPKEKLLEKNNKLNIKIPYDDFKLVDNSEPKIVLLSCIFDIIDGNIKITEYKKYPPLKTVRPKLTKAMIEDLLRT